MRKFVRLAFVLTALQLALASCATPASSCGYSGGTKFLTPMTPREFGRDLRALNQHRAAFVRLVEFRDAGEIAPAAETVNRSIAEITEYKSAVPSNACASFGDSAQRLQRIRTQLALAATATDWEALRELDKELDAEISNIRKALPRWWWKRRTGPRIRAGL